MRAIERSDTVDLHLPPRPGTFLVLGLLILLLAATGCGGGGGGSAGLSSGAPSAPSGGGDDGGGGDPPPDPGGDPGDDAGGETQSVDAFEQTLYPLVRQYCATCHAGAGPGFPHFAHPDVATAHRQTLDNQKVDLADPADSRMIEKIAGGHFCWSGDCAADAAEIQAAIEAWAQLLGMGDPADGGGDPAPPDDGDDPPPPDDDGGGGDPGGNPGADGIESGALSLADGSASGSSRFQTFEIARWQFKTGAGDTAFDTSGVAPAIDLALSGVTWVTGGGIENVSGKATAPATTSRKLYDRIARNGGSQQYAIEAWVIPANLDQEGPARIVSYSQGTGERNFTLGQEATNYNFRNRNSDADVSDNGTPALETDGDEVATALTHVVATYTQAGGRRLYLNGVDTGDADPEGGGNLLEWNAGYAFVLGNETGNNRLWRGQLLHVSIHDRALTPAQIAQNFDAGISERFLLRFPLDPYLGAGSFLELEASEYDGYSYLFCEPRLVSPNVASVPVEGIRVAVNGSVPVMSQSFAELSAVASANPYDLSSLCTVVPKDNGPADDLFTLTFERLGDASDPYVEADPPPLADPEPGEPLPEIGVRAFEQINRTFSEVTTVPASAGSVRNDFREIRQQLPSTTDPRSFVTAHQVAIANLAFEYCDALVSSGSLRSAYFPGFDFGAVVVVAFASQADRDRIIDPLLDRMVGQNLLSQPDRASLEAELNGLLDTLTEGCNAGSCDATRTQATVKGLCTAVLSSAPVTLQ